MTIKTNARVARILIEDGKAIGVTFVSGGAQQTVRTRGEVIVCGGVFNSPQLLQMSGLGPPELLQEFDIPVIRAIPAIGANLQDHFNVRLVFRCTKRITLNHVANSPIRQALAALQYGLFKSGPLANNGVCAGGFARSNATLNRPDLQLDFINWSVAARDGREVRAHRFPGFSVDVVHLRPLARGSVRLKSPDPLATPEIRFNFLRQREDVNVITVGMRLARKIVRQPALASYVAEEITPGPASKPIAISRPAFARAASPTCIPWVPAEWVERRLRCSTHDCGCAELGICVSSTRR